MPYEGSFLGIRNRMDRPAAYESGGAGLVSTIEDYALFAGMLLEKGSGNGTRILKPESVEQMMTVGLTQPQQAAFERWFGQKGYDYGWLMRGFEGAVHGGFTRPEGENTAGMAGLAAVF